MADSNFDFKGLTSEQVKTSREKHGQNLMTYKKENAFFSTLKRIAKDPMFILLAVAASIYFLSGKIGDGIFLSVAIIFQTSISLFQYKRSKNALEKLKEISQPHCKVIRNGKSEAIKSEELVLGDFLQVEEGGAINADGTIVQSNDFSVNESVITGESFAVVKDKENNIAYSGTTVSSGMAIVEITAIGNETKLGKIGKSLEQISEEKTPLELQIANFVQKMAILGAVVFVLVWIINYFHSKEILNSLLKSLTLAMSILPEEIPVAFTTFMAIGSWRLMKNGIIVKQMKTVETLGSATVICVDKTGTITENKMSLARIFTLKNNAIQTPSDKLDEAEKELISLAMWASEPVPFDAMETALHLAYNEFISDNLQSEFKLIHEYALGGQPPMMTHVFENKTGQRIIAAKGAVEAIMNVSKLTDADKKHIIEAVQLLAKDGFRILGVGEATFKGNAFPQEQQALEFEFKGMVAFYDPPKKNIQHVFEQFYNAGIAVKIITGDGAETTMAIAKQIQFQGNEKSINGDEIMKLDESALGKCVIETSIFTRMFPEAKLKVINALKSQNQIVAMTGDGVNDGPALKAAHIGIAMGKKGTEIAKQAASLILLEDDLSKMIDAIAMGRKIYSNLKKAIQYIISIHIPIILTVFIPLAFGWLYPTLFSPIHIIFLEIIMGPTCSIIYENEPLEKNTMLQAPKALTTTFFKWRELSISIVQGILIAIGTLSVYQYAVLKGYDEALTRTMTFLVLITANILLTLINRSFYYSILTTLSYKNRMIPFIIFTTIAIVSVMLSVPTITTFFEFETPSFSQFAICISVGFVSVSWFEVAKWIKRW